MSGFKDKIAGKVDKAKGAAKEKAGKFLDDQTKVAEGQADKAKGAIKETSGKIKDKLDN